METLHLLNIHQEVTYHLDQDMDQHFLHRLIVMHPASTQTEADGYV